MDASKYSSVIRTNPPNGMGTVRLGRGGVSNFHPTVLAFYYSDCYLSNCFKREYTTSDGKKFDCAQQHFQYEKALYFEDMETAEKILKCSSAKGQKALGRKVKNYNDNLWCAMRDYIMERVVLEKFSSDPALRERFLADVKPEYVIAEAGPSYELHWGTGVYLPSFHALNTDKWTGENVLGRILGLVYSELEKMKKSDMYTYSLSAK